MDLPLRTAFLGLLAIALATLTYVLFAQHVQGYAPCELCLLQRWPWYILIALTALGAARPSKALLALAALTLLVSVGFAAYHSGVELKWWEGPSACTTSSSGANSVEELRAMMMAEPVVRCDEIAWTFLDLSMSNYNFLLSLALFGLTASALRKRGSA